MFLCKCAAATAAVVRLSLNVCLFCPHGGALERSPRLRPSPNGDEQLDLGVRYHRDGALWVISMKVARKTVEIMEERCVIDDETGGWDTVCVLFFFCQAALWC